MSTESPTVGDLYNLLARLYRRLHDKHQSSIHGVHSPSCPSRNQQPPSGVDAQLPAPVSVQHGAAYSPAGITLWVEVDYQSDIHHATQQSTAFSSEVAYYQADCLRDIEDAMEELIPKLRQLDEIKAIIQRNLEETKSNMLQRIKFLQFDLVAFRDEYYEIEDAMDEDEEQELWDKVQGGAMDVDELQEELEKDFNENLGRLKENREELMDMWNLVLDTANQAKWLLGDH